MARAKPPRHAPNPAPGGQKSINLVEYAAAMDPVTTLATREPEAAVPAPIRKPLPPEHFVDHGTNAEMRWDVPHGPGDTPASRLFVRNHTETLLLDAATYTLLVHGDGLRSEAVLSLDDIRALPVTRASCARCRCTRGRRSCG